MHVHFNYENIRNGITITDLTEVAFMYSGYILKRYTTISKTVTALEVKYETSAPQNSPGK